MSQQELVARLGLSFQAIQKYETGENRIKVSRLFEAASLLDCAVSFFLEGLGSASGSSQQRAFTRGELDLMTRYRGIANPTLRMRLFQLTQTVAEFTKVLPRRKRSRRKA